MDHCFSATRLPASQGSALAAEAHAAIVIVDLGFTPDIDVDGADMLSALNGQLHASGGRLLLARADGERLGLLRRAGTVQAIGEENLFVTVRDAVAAAGATPRLRVRQTAGEPSTPSRTLPRQEDESHA